MAAFLNKFLPNAFCFAHNAIFDVPRPIICVGGAEYGRLSREVMRLSRSRRFFLPRCSDPSPSTSVTGRDLFITLERLAGLVGGGELVEAKESRRAGVGPAVKVKVLGAELGLAVCQANLILTGLKDDHVWKPS